MDFVNFARNHGLIINSVNGLNKWISTPTEDRPRSTNGRYKLLGDVGWVINWATMEKPAMWRSEGNLPLSTNIRKQIDASNRERELMAQKASAKADWILQQTELLPHPYLEKKGFPNEEGNVWRKDGESILVIPMRLGKALVGCQLVTEQGEKKFLHGQSSKGATFVIGAEGTTFFCEGYATALSVRQIMKTSNLSYCINVCFSASNMKFVARNKGKGIIIADNDANGVGESCAKETGYPYWISETVGEDFNDYHVRVGSFRASQTLKKFLLGAKT